MRKSRIFTHRSLDLDACLAVLAVILYCFKEDFISFFRDPMWRKRIILVPANWDGSDMEDGDIAVDIEAGGKGKKGEIENSEEGKRVNSAFLKILTEHAPAEDREALADIAYYINENDATGSVVGSVLGPELIYRKEFILLMKIGSIESVFRAAQLHFGYKDEKKVIQHFVAEFDGYLKMGIKNIKAKNLYSERVIRHGKKDKIAFINTQNAPLELCNLAFSKGVEIIVYKNGDDLGIKRRHGCELPVNHPLVMKYIEDNGERVTKGKGEEGAWFLHDTFHLLCTGTYKNRATFKTKVRPDQLIYALCKAYDPYDSMTTSKKKEKKTTNKLIAV